MTSAYEMETRFCKNDGRPFKVMVGSSQDVCSLQCEYVNGRLSSRATKDSGVKVKDEPRDELIRRINEMFPQAGITKKELARKLGTAAWKVSAITKGLGSVTDRELGTTLDLLETIVEERADHGDESKR
nr:hypothetical protein CKG001_10500 [Bdellovibrio sp. CKG001]